MSRNARTGFDIECVIVLLRLHDFLCTGEDKYEYIISQGALSDPQARVTPSINS